MSDAECYAFLSGLILGICFLVLPIYNYGAALHSNPITSLWASQLALSALGIYCSYLPYMLIAQCLDGMVVQVLHNAYLV